MTTKSTKNTEVEAIPFSEADVPTLSGTFHTVKASLSDDRTVAVGYSDNGQRYIRIERPTMDGKRSRLAFGLSKEAAASLTQLLMLTFEDEFAGGKG